MKPNERTLFATPYLRRESRPHPWTPGRLRPTACSSTWCCDCRWLGTVTDSWWSWAFAGWCSLADSCWVLVVPEIWFSSAVAGWFLWHIVRLWSERESENKLVSRFSHLGGGSQEIEEDRIMNNSGSHQLTGNLLGNLHLISATSSFLVAEMGREKGRNRSDGRLTYLDCSVNPLIIALWSKRSLGGENRPLTQRFALLERFGVQRRKGAVADNRHCALSAEMIWSVGQESWFGLSKDCNPDHRSMSDAEAGGEFEHFWASWFDCSKV